MKLRHLQESLTASDRAAAAFAEFLVEEAKRDAKIQSETGGVTPDADLLHKAALSKLREFTQKIETEIYHLVY